MLFTQKHANTFKVLDLEKRLLFLTYIYVQFIPHKRLLKCLNFFITQSTSSGEDKTVGTLQSELIKLLIISH